MVIDKTNKFIIRIDQTIEFYKYFSAFFCPYLCLCNLLVFFCTYDDGSSIILYFLFCFLNRFVSLLSLYPRLKLNYLQIVCDCFFGFFFFLSHFFFLAVVIFSLLRALQNKRDICSIKQNSTVFTTTN